MCWRIKKLIITLQLKHLTIKKKYYRHYIQYMHIFVTHRFLRYKNSVVSSSVSHFCLLFPTLQIFIINMHFKHKFILDVYTAWEELHFLKFWNTLTYYFSHFKRTEIRKCINILSPLNRKEFATNHVISMNRQFWFGQIYCFSIWCLLSKSRSVTVVNCKWLTIRYQWDHQILETLRKRTASELFVILNA